MVIKDLQQHAQYFSEYTELRVQENRTLRIAMVNGDVMVNSKESISGVSARVYKSGVWGFSSSPEISEAEIQKVIAAATENASVLDAKEQKSNDPLPRCIAEADIDFSTKKSRTSQKELIQYVKELDTHIIEKYPKLNSRVVQISALDMEKSLLTSAGSQTYSLIPRTTIVIAMTMMDKNGAPVELYEVVADRGQPEDVIPSIEVTKKIADDLFENLLQKSEGIYPDAGIKDCILDADLAGMLAHEAIGHTTEADIVMAGSVAGNFLNQEVASPLISLVDFAHTAFGNTCPVPVYADDEGVKAEDVVIIKDGVLKSYMHNKESAIHYNVEVTGNARAYGFSDEPLIRMRNTAILPGTSKLEDMIASIEDGYYLIKASNGQADSTSEFTFGVIKGFEIKNGNIGRALRDTTVSGIAFDVLKSVTMVSDDMKWECAGMCGKKQLIPVAAGGPSIKCKVNIGGE